MKDPTSKSSSTSCAMPSFPDHQHHVRRVVLPSGKTIEVVYFEDVAGAPDAPASGGVALHHCPQCASDLVHPVAWDEAGPDHWDVALRCPNCEWTGSGVYAQAAIDRFDAHLDRGTETLVEDLRRLVQANMEDGIDRFVAALGADLIVPEDF
jgi:hypothetical protein